MGVPTGISLDSAPAGKSSLATLPSSCASKSMEALSVSILAKTSPAEKESPSLTYHSAKEPPDMVGLKAGSPTTI